MSAGGTIVERLSRIDCCALSDALDKLGLPGTVTGLRPLSSDRRIAGRVRTVKLVKAGEVPPAVKPRHLGTTAIERSEAGEIIVVEQRTGQDCGSWGGILSLGAKLRGVAGVIAEGPIRDVDEARQMDFPVFARSTTAFTARGRVVEQSTDEPIQVGDVTVSCGDFVVADGSAVIFLSANDAERILDVAETIVAREAAMSRALLAGTPITEVMGANYENMLER